MRIGLPREASGRREQLGGEFAEDRGQAGHIEDTRGALRVGNVERFAAQTEQDRQPDEAGEPAERDAAPGPSASIRRCATAASQPVGTAAARATTQHGRPGRRAPRRSSAAGRRPACPGALRYQWPSSIACTVRPTTSPESSRRRRRARIAAGARTSTVGRRAAAPRTPRSRRGPAALSLGIPGDAPHPGRHRRRRGQQPEPAGSADRARSAANVASPSTTSRFTRKKPAGTSAGGVSTSASASPQPNRQRKSTRASWRHPRRGRSSRASPHGVRLP